MFPTSDQWNPKSLEPLEGRAFEILGSLNTNQDS